MTSNYKVNDGVNPVYDIGDTFVSKSYSISTYHTLKPSIKLAQLWAWGNNTNGQLGLGDTAARSSPVQVGSLTNWKSISATPNITLAPSVFTKTDGTIWASGGSASNGQLGNGTTTGVSSPVQVVGAIGNSACRSVSNGAQHALAIQGDGTLWGWGFNVSGCLGGGAVSTAYSSPIQISTTSWKQISCGYNTSIGVRSDGTLWSWGTDAYGYGGKGTINSTRSSPTQIGTLTTWRTVQFASPPQNSHIGSAAIQNDGTLWTWGDNYFGKLGQGDVNPRSSPVQVGSLTNWKLVAGNVHHFAAVKTDGTLWTWGNNASAQLGLGDLNHRSSPVQVGSLTNWKYVACNAGSMIALKTDGTLWSWGTGPENGQPASLSSPVQLGTATSWKYVAASGGASYGILEAGGW